MSELVYVDSGTGIAVVVDEVAGGAVQYVKLMVGTEDSTAKIGGDATYGLDVDVSRIQAPIYITGGSIAVTGSTVTANMSAGGALTSTVVGSDRALDVNIVQTVVSGLRVTGGTITITGNSTDYATNTSILAISSLLATISGHVDGIETALAGTLTVDAASLDVRPLVATIDYVTVSGAALNAIQTAVEGTITVDNAGTFAVQATQAGSWATDVSNSTIAVTGGTVATEATLATISGRLNTLVETATGVGIYIQPNSSFQVYTTLHDQFSCNANLQWDDTDVSYAWPLPVDMVVPLGRAYEDGESTPATVTGGALMWNESGTTLRAVSTDAPLPIQGSVGINTSIQIYTTTHDQLMLNANLQVNDTDVSATNPVIVHPSGGTFSVTIDADNVGIGGGVLYASGDTPTIPTGTMIMFQGAGDVAQSISSTRPLPVTGTFSVDGSALTITGNTTDFATETTLGTLATESTLSTLSNTLSTVSGHVDGIETLLGGTLTVDATGQGDVPITLGGEVVAASQSGTWNIGTVTTITNDVNVADGGNSLTVDNAGGFVVLPTGGTIDTITNTVTVVAGGSWPVYSTTHDQTNVNANMQIGDADVDNGNSVPINDAGGSITVDGNWVQNGGTIAVTGGSIAISSIPSVAVTGGTIEVTQPDRSRLSILVSGTDGVAVLAPGPSTHLKIHHITFSNHGGPIRFKILDGFGGSALGEYSLAESGGGMGDYYGTALSTNTALYYDYDSSDYNPLMSINVSYESVAE